MGKAENRRGDRVRKDLDVGSRAFPAVGTGCREGELCFDVVFHL